VNLRMMLLVLLLPVVLDGCARYTLHGATQSSQVYAVRSKPGRSDVVYTCDARNSNPVCIKVREISR
jgi:hypothetical protein